MSGVGRRWRELSATTRSLCVFALLGSLAANVVLMVLPNGGRQMALAYAAGVVLFQTDTDSWDPMHAALEHVESDERTPLYQELLFRRGVKFQYPPTSLLAVEPLMRSPYARPPRYTLLNVLSFVAVLATVGLSILLFERGAAPAVSRFDKSVRLGALLVLGLTFYPVTRPFILGQVQTWLNLGAAVMLAAWCFGKEALAGVVAGLMCVFKPHYGLLLVWAALRRRFSMLVTGSVTVAAVLALSIARYGFADHTDYLSALVYLSRVGESYYANQSVNGLVSRMVFAGDNLEWHGNTFPPFSPLVYGATIASTLVLLGTALFWPRPNEDRPRATDLMIMLLSTTMASSIAWEHHYGILLPMFALAVPVLLRFRPCGRWTLVLLVAAYALTSLRLSITDLVAGTRWNFLQSYVLAGAALFLVLLYRLRARDTGEDSAVSLARSQR